MVPNSFLGSVGPLESKNVNFRQKIEKLGFLAEISACGCPARPQKIFRIQNLSKFIQKFFWLSNSILKSNYEKNMTPLKQGF